MHFTSKSEIVIVVLMHNQNWFYPNHLLFWVLWLETGRLEWLGKETALIKWKKAQKLFLNKVFEAQEFIYVAA